MKYPKMAGDRPDKKKPAYLAGFFGDFFFAGFGSGGIASIRRNTSSAERSSGRDADFFFMGESLHV